MKNLFLSIIMLGISCSSLAFNAWTSSNSSIFSISNNEAQFQQPQGSYQESIMSDVMFFTSVTEADISFNVSGFNNAGWNSCSSTPIMRIDLLDADGYYIKTISNQSLSDGQKLISISVDQVDEYRISIKITTDRCNNNSLPTIVLSNLQIPEAILPIFINNLYVDIINTSHKINWELNTFDNISFVELQHSNDGVSFDYVMSVDSGIDHFYNYDVKPGLNLYRLKLHFDDGSIMYSNSSFVFSDYIINEIEPIVYPVPVTQYVTIGNIDNPKGHIYNNAGLLVGEFSTRTINLSSLTKGLYYIIIEDELGKKYTQIIIKD